MPTCAPGPWEDVADWAETAESGFAESAHTRAAIVKHGVSGSILLVLDSDDLADEFGITSSLERKKIMLAIDGLKDTKEERQVYTAP